MSKNLYLGLIKFLFFLHVFFRISSLQQVHGNTELRALMEVKASLDPENKILSSWTNDGDPCSGTFEGVACNEHNKVANITLQSKGLSGKLSPAVSELKFLSGLYLHYNSLFGEIPKEISYLTELVDLYLDVNNLSGSIPPEIGNMASLQALQLGCNQLTGHIPQEIKTLAKLNVLALQYNQLSGTIPGSLGNLSSLKWLYLSFNHLSGLIPASLADIPQLEVLHLQNNSLSGVVPSSLKKLNEGLQYGNNSDLCGVGFISLRNCTAWDMSNVNTPDQSNIFKINATVPLANPEAANITRDCNHTKCSNSSKMLRVGIVAGVSAASVTVMVVGFLIFFRFRRSKQKIGSTTDMTDCQLSPDQTKDFRSRSTSPLVRLEYSNGWDPCGVYGSSIEFTQECSQVFKFNLEEVESATLYFSETNLLGKSNFSSVHKGVLRDGSFVAVKSISITSCKSEEDEFVKGLNLLTSLKHSNLVRLRGFCCSKGRGECFLIYDFAPNGNLSKYLDIDDSRSQVLNWSTRVSIISGIAKGLEYLHSNKENKSALLHRNLSLEKILLDEHYNPLISSSGLHKLLADDIVYSALKVSAAMGYLAPEYITTGRFTQKSDVYAFGVIILQIVSGKQLISNSVRLAAESCRFEEFVDTNLKDYSKSEASKLGKIAMACVNEDPDQRPTMETVVQELSTSTTYS
ncbi:Serine-threonine/tyrosine-protein kinase, catalytic domain [Dillenia turbinata]|uniref:Serine-threonine/tyrosine-protein kinase, catalytic domain n=1 Tax=Dillenia turbinata TaxID=194707 RepID=A0AAN8VJ84_9MAGN